MPVERAEFLWETASDADRAAVMEMWWAEAHPDPGSDESLILQWMSGPDTYHGDPEAAKKGLVERGLLEPGCEGRPSFTESGRAVFFRLYDTVYR